MSKQVRRIEFIRCVDTKAEEFNRQGYSVKANITGWGKPPTIEGMIPDIRAKKGNQVILGAMLREDELDRINEYEKLIKYAENTENTSFRVYLTAEDNKPKLYKIY
jgi:hypothetical protein